jgi:hypothetical protein
MLMPAMLALAVLVAGCSDGGGGGSNDDDPNPGGGVDVDGNLTTGNGTGNGTTEPPMEEICETDPDATEVGDYYVKEGGVPPDVYEESNGMPDLQTPATCPGNPDDQVTFFWADDR